MKSNPHGFSILELLVVVAILGIVLAFVVPSADQALRGSSLVQSGQLVADQITAARQAAIARNRMVFVRFYKLPLEGEEGASFSAMQTFVQEDDGDTRPLGKIAAIHDNVVIAESPRYSTLIAGPTVSGSDTVSGKSASYVGFRFRPDGSTDLDLTAGDGWFLTLVNRNPPLTEEDAPRNFYTIRVDPHTGRTRIFRP